MAGRRTLFSSKLDEHMEARTSRASRANRQDAEHLRRDARDFAFIKKESSDIRKDIEDGRYAHALHESRDIDRAVDRLRGRDAEEASPPSRRAKNASSYPANYPNFQKAANRQFAKGRWLLDDGSELHGEIVTAEEDARSVAGGRRLTVRDGRTGKLVGLRYMRGEGKIRPFRGEPRRVYTVTWRE